MKKLLLLLVAGSLCGVFAVSCLDNKTESEEIPDQISYNFHVRPILSDKCFNCHGPDGNKREAGLRLDIAEEAYKALAEHPRAHAIVPGKPELSELYIRVSSTDTSMRMPPAAGNLPALTPGEIAIIKKWIEQGAKYERHWAFNKPRKPSIPKVRNEKWAINEIDFFVLSTLEKKGLEPNKEADKERLLKRVYFDLIGLPPTPEEISRFVNDASPDAYEKEIDRLMKRPQFGERMAIGWLDLARYADSHGYQDDNYRTQWPWRDWIINAFNKNVPYDQFVTWQLAGDLLPNATKEQMLATGFNRNHKITEEGGVIDEEYRSEYVTDRTNTLGRAFMGVTVECAKCHDHKFDPISQKEYFSLYAFFNNVKEVGLESVVGGAETYAKNPRMEITRDDISNLLQFINKTDTNKLEVSVMKDNDTVRKTFLLDRGNYDAPTVEVQPATPAAILAFPSDYPKNRLGLSKWLFHQDNPLTARVFVNRLWQEYFGKGLVKSTADFGMQGDLPSHPELLDWLSVSFMESGWNIQKLVKTIMLSATYRQSAESNERKQNIDPENIYLSHAPRIRLHAELVRDLILSSSGLLNPVIGGPSVKPYQPEGLWELATSGRGQLRTYKQDTGALLYRRGMYTFIKRTVPPPSMMIFDGSNRDQCEVKRLRTNTPLQALVMMNDPTIIEASRALADKLLLQKLSADAAVDAAFTRIICRKPEKKELDLLVQYYNDRKEYFKGKQGEAEKMMNIGQYQATTKSAQDLAAMMQVLQVIYNMEEAITKS